jgi:hypothetical protein
MTMATIKQKRLGIAMALMVAVGLVLPTATACAGAARGPAKIELSAAAFDFGAIPNTDPVSQVFQVRNVGESELEIVGVSTSCGCTTAEVDTRRVARGQEADLTVTYDPQVHAGETGEYLRMVYVRSNDPEMPEASLEIRVTVVEPGGEA